MFVQTNVEFLSQNYFFVDHTTTLVSENYISLYRSQRCRYPVNMDITQTNPQNYGCRYKNTGSYDNKSLHKNHLPGKG